MAAPNWLQTVAFQNPSICTPGNRGLSPGPPSIISMGLKGFVGRRGMRAQYRPCPTVCQTPSMEADTQRPGDWPPAHVHMHVIEVGSRTNSIDDIHFENGLNLSAVIGTAQQEQTRIRPGELPSGRAGSLAGDEGRHPGGEDPGRPLAGSEAISDSQPPGRSCIGPIGPGRS